MTPPRGHVAALDGMRGLAIGLVLLYHGWVFTGASDLGAAIDRARSIGWAGVDVFFVLSGFLITGILLETRRAPRYWRDFLVRRGLRIFPLYYAVLLLLAAASRFIAVPALDHLWINFLYLTNFAIAVWGENRVPLDIAWSLAIEEQFYLLYPWLVRRLSPRALAGVLLAVIAAAPVARVLIWAFGAQPTLGPYVLPYARFDALAYGALIRLAFELDRARLVAAIARLAPVLGAAALVVLYAWPRKDVRFIAIGYSTTAIAAAALLARVLLAPPAALVRRWFESGWLVYLGKISYGVYLLHLIARVAAGKLLDKVFAPGARGELAYCAAEMLSMIALAVLAASVSYHLFERPILRLKDRLAPPRVLASSESS